MIFNTFGDSKNPPIIMLPGSFCPAKSMEGIYSALCDKSFIIAPDYNGHYENSSDFTTRQNEACEIKNFIIENNIKSVKMIYGQSMGSEIGIELMRQLMDEGVRVEYSFFDGAPCIKLSKLYKAFMHFKFKTMINIVRKKTVDDVMNYSIVKKFSCGDAEALRSSIEAMKEVSPHLTDATIKNETECCYTFDFPSFDEETQKRMYFFFAKDEKACKTCLKHIKKAYPSANYKIVSGYGHLTYASRHPSEYLLMLRNICEDE